ncbi:putative membrane protein [Methanocalculus sp. AMF5]|nr:putative membrane protein [Methanocalculus sp. AMF5]
MIFLSSHADLFTRMIGGILIGTAIGVVLGTISGCTPGIHSNTMAGILLGVHPALLVLFGPAVFAASVTATLVTHTFLDAVPSTFLGVPDPDTAIAVLPAHALCMKGLGEEAVRIAALGSAAGAGFGLILFPLFFLLLAPLQPYLDWWIGILLITVAGILIVRSAAPEWAAAVFIASGILGLFSMGYSYLSWQVLPGGSPLLLPLLTGLFGLPVLLKGAEGTVPEQRYSGIRMEKKEIAGAAAAGTVAGAIVGWMPGFSNATANAVLASFISYTRQERGYILATSAANTANAFLGIAALYALSRVRNGAMAAIATDELPPLFGIMAAACLAAVVAYPLTVLSSKGSQVLARLNIRRLNLTVIVFLLLLTAFVTGPFGLLILGLATAIGSVPPLVSVQRVFCMGAIMVPIICWSILGVPIF